MKLLITQGAYSANNSLTGVTANHVATGITINSVTTQCVYCDVTDAAGFEQVRTSLNADSYTYSVDGNILIPKELL